MRTLGLLMLLPLAAHAQGQDQSVAPPALIRGIILECDSQAPAGELAVRDAGNEVFRYQFDAKTYAERDGQLIQAWRLKPGEKVEVVSDR